MRRIYLLLIVGLYFPGGILIAQEILPGFTVKNNKSKISVSWQNKYKQNIKSISIQRSYDSTKNFSSIYTLPNPSDAVNGYMDIHAPYTKMYYKLFVVFDSGEYIFTAVKKPEIDNRFDLTSSIKKIRDENNRIKDSIEKANRPVKITAQPKIKDTTEKTNKPEPVLPVKEEDLAPKKDVITYPSKRIFTDKNNNINIILPDYKTNSYVIKFFDENYKHLFDLKHINEGFLILEKFNFRHAGWFFFEIYEDGGLFEKNKIFIPKD
ncbi:MAG TPA: hypothetical protein PK987_06260 [Ferruginibacter sp.]|nr:hypothetical protein [Ferruginibacter sp.]